MNQIIYEKLVEIVGKDNVLVDESMKKHTTFRIGGVADFFKLNVEEGKLDIITNPPYNDRLAEIISRCIKLCRQKVAILMPLRYLSSNARYNDIYKNNPPARVYVYQERICIAKNGDFETYNDAGANLEIYAWYIWEKGYIGEPILRWIHNEK